MSSKLDITNAESLTYENELLKLTVLGGIKLEGLDRMRATLKVELKQTSLPPVRHNLDLYNDTQTEKLIRKVAEKLEIGTSIIAASLAELTGQLETYRIEQIKNKEPEMPQRPVLTGEQRKEAEDFLKALNLIERTNELIGKSGVVGEEINRLIMYLIFTSRKRPQPLHIVSLGSSGTGKTHLQEKVGELIPEEDRIEITTLSENAFYYFGQRELKNKLILIEDLDGAENVLYPLRELQSKKRISKTVAHKNSKGETKTMHLIVEGPVSVAGCTTREHLYEDNANRSFLIYLDESEEQDGRIMDYQRALSANKIDQDKEQEIQTLLKNTQRVLEPIKVVNPYAELLCLPQAVFKPRRTNNHYLQFIEAVTFYHQHQRQIKADEHGEAFIETTLEDIKESNTLLKEILLRKTDDLAGATRDHLTALKKWTKEKGKTSFGNRETSRYLRKPIATVKRHHYQLVELGYLTAEKQKETRSYLYKLAPLANEERREQTINQSLEQALHAVTSQIKESISSSGSPSAQSPNEPSNTQEISEKTPSAQ
ncbi:MAG: hypothetical protein JXR03_20545 [Cyclobacteriaceae bacterium]